MNRLTKIAFFALLLTSADSALAGALEDQAAAEYAAFNEVFNKGDAKGVAALYAPGALILPASHDIVKYAGIEDFFSGLFKAGVTDHTLEVINVIDAGDTHIVSAKWTAKGKDASGNAASFGGVATHVFQKQSDGSYKLMLHTFN